MAKNPRTRKTFQTGEEEIGFVTRSEDFLSKDPQGLLSKFEGRFAVFDSVAKKLENALKSSTDNIEYLGASLKKKIDTGELIKEQFIKSSSLAEAQKAIDFTNQKLIGSGNLNQLSDASRLAVRGDTYSTLETVRRITGAENKALLADIAKEKGFSVSYSKQKGFEDFATIKYRAEKSLLESYMREHEDYLSAKEKGLPWGGSKEARLTAESRFEKETFGSLFSQSDKLYKANKAEEERREIQKALEEEEKTQRAEEEKQRALEEKKQETFEKQERRAYNQEQRRIQRQIERLEGKTALDGRSYAEIFEASRDENSPVLTRKEELEAYKSIEAEDKKAREEQAQKERERKESEASKRGVLGLGFKIVAGIVALTDIVRRLLTAVLDKASKERSDFIGGATLGVSAVDVRNYRNIEKAKGLPENSFMGFFSDLQANFGDERHINENALAEIAPYIPEAVVPLVRTGKMDLQELAKIILDKAQSLVEEGKNWNGENVGVTEARRSILTSLGRFSPHAKAIVENMVDTDLYGVFAGKAKGVDAYLEAGVGAKTKFSETELAQYKEVVQLVDGIKGQFKTIKDDIMTDIVRSFSGIANFLYNLDIGKSDEEKLKDQIERRDRVSQSMTEMTNIKSTMRNLIGSRLEGLDLASIGGKDFNDVDTMLDYIMKKSPVLLMAKLQGSSAYAPLRNILSSEEVLAMLGAYKIASESYEELEKQSKKPLDEIKYNYTDYTQAGMAVRASEDPLIKMFKGNSTPWEAHQYALSSDKGYKPLMSEPDLFEDFNEVLSYIQEAPTKKIAEKRDLNMRQALDMFTTYLARQTGHYVGINSKEGVAPKSADEAIQNIHSYLKGFGYTLTESDFAKLNSIITGMPGTDAYQRVTGIKWNDEGKLAPYQKSLDYKKRKQLEQYVSALISASEGGALPNLMEDAIRKAKDKGWNMENTNQNIRLRSLDEGKLKIDVTVNNEAKRDGFTVSAGSRLTTPTLTDKIDFSLNVNNR